MPIYGFYFNGDDITPESGRVTFTFNDRVTRVDGQRIYPNGTSVTRTIGDTQLDTASAAARDAVRAAWRAADQTAQGGAFDGAAWDARWNVLLTGAVFASVPASDDPDIVQTGYQIKVVESLNSSSGRSYYVTPLLAQIGTTPPGINLGLVDVPPGSPTVPAPIYAKGMAGGVASLDSSGLVPVNQLPSIAPSTPARTVTANTSLVLNDLGGVVVVNSATAKTVTVPTNASVSFPIGARVDIANIGTGTVSVIDASTSTTATVISAKGRVTLLLTGTDTWMLT